VKKRSHGAAADGAFGIAAKDVTERIAMQCLGNQERSRICGLQFAMFAGRLLARDAAKRRLVLNVWQLGAT
jgi:hypothetical protein